MDAISLDLIGLTYPDACIGSMGDRLLLAGLWPILSILLGGAAIALVKTADISDHMSAVRDAFVEKAGYRPMLQPLRTGSRADIQPIISP